MKKKTYMRPCAELYKFCAEVSLLTTSLPVHTEDGATSGDGMLSGKKGWDSSNWSGTDDDAADE